MLQSDISIERPTYSVFMLYVQTQLTEAHLLHQCDPITDLHNSIKFRI